MNGGEQQIFDRVGSVEDHCIEMKKDIEYIKEKLDSHLKWSETQVAIGHKRMDRMEEKINWNENKIYLFMGAAVVISTIISIMAPILFGA